MKLRYKQQKFQADAARAVADVFAGQPYLLPSCKAASGTGDGGKRMSEPEEDTGRSNAEIVPGLTDRIILEQLNRVQRENGIEPSERLEGRYNLTVEMETGVGKTYTYIKTMYELNRRYGWSKFIVVVPGIAVREGVYRTFQTTQEHFAGEYGKKVRFFMYRSDRLAEIDRFASDPSISVMIINAQAFNAKGKDARRIHMELDAFRSRRPIDIIARTRPIVIIDEPQSVEGRQTKENLKRFRPLMTLRYSATHRADSIYNMVYRLDAVDAYQKRLVKKIAVKGITETGTASHGYVYLERINLSRAAPTATLQFDHRGASGIRRRSARAGAGFDLYEHSGDGSKLEAYRDGYVVTSVDGRDDSVEFRNGIRLHAGDVIGSAGEEQIRRIQIRETILSHIDRERQLFRKGIKVLSLFFIDEVAHYKVYDGAGRPGNGLFAKMFEEEYENILETVRHEGVEEDYRHYLDSIPVNATHAGYFSVDKRGHMVDRVAGDDKKNGFSNDIDAYDLIMKNKELLLDPDPERSPVRFIFSHSALREGWDNPNVFQICTLKQSGSDVRKRQEVGRGLRLCVNRDGERMDENVLGGDVHRVNVLTVIASESYDSFAKGLQKEIAGSLRGKQAIPPENARRSRVELQVDREKLAGRAFRELWAGIRTKSVYRVDFDPEALVSGCIAALDEGLEVSGSGFRVETGVIAETGAGERFSAGISAVKPAWPDHGGRTGRAGSPVRYDLVGKLADESGLTRDTVVRILTGIRKEVFDQFRQDPEEFIIRAGALIREQKAGAVMGHVIYEAAEEMYGTEIFTAPTLRGRSGVNVMKAEKHLYDHVIYDSAWERDFILGLEAAEEVAVYVKLPDGFYISTPAGRYTPGWAVAFHRDGGYVCCVTETRGSAASGRRMAEALKIHCAKAHFEAVGDGKVIYDTVESFASLLKIAKAEKGEKGENNKFS